MPFALLVALAASLGAHALLLFGTDLDLSLAPEPAPLVAELKPLPPPQARPKPPATPPLERRRVERRTPPPAPVEAASGAGLATLVPEPALVAAPAGTPAPTDSAPPSPVDAGAASHDEHSLPSHMTINYRVDRGDANFEIGRARQEWHIDGDRYRLFSVAETSGIVWLFKSYRVEMESRGRLTPEGLRPDSFVIRRDGREGSEKAAFDWDNMTVRVGEREEQALTPGAQDLLSFNYQLGFMALAKDGANLPIATGKKFETYHLEVLGDETIDVPAGNLRTLHLRAPGTNSTELWLAYDYLLLPVKIRHVDSKGDSLVQVATQIQLSQD